ncbi:MAG: hypothetical protein H7315_15840 [Herminiimonas sp.]|nr:hypothetical protein [Herminiimonas sp.]
MTPPLTTRMTPGIYLVAGDIGGAGHLDGTGADSRFRSLGSLTIDSQGNLFATESDGTTAEIVRKITSEGVVSTPGPLDGSTLAIDMQGNRYVSTAVAIFKVAADGTRIPFAGAEEAPGNVDGQGRQARFLGIRKLTFDRDGNVYVADQISHACPPCVSQGGTIRKITPNGLVSTLAGMAGMADSTDGIGATAHFANPHGIVFDPFRNVLLVPDRKLRQVTMDGVVTTLALTFSGLVNSANFGISDLAIDRAGTLFATNRSLNVIYKIMPNGDVSEFAGSSATFSYGDSYANGVGAAARFNSVGAIVTDVSGNLFVADTGNYAIRKITPTGEVSTLAGMPGERASLVNGAGPLARLNAPSGVSIDAAGNLYVGDTGNSAIRKISTTGNVSVLGPADGAPGQPLDGVAAVAKIAYPLAMVVDGRGMIYFVDQLGRMIRKIAVDGTVSTLAGASGKFTPIDGTGDGAGFANISGMVADTQGVLYVADQTSVRKVWPDGVVTTIAGSVSPGMADGSASQARFARLDAIALDKTGNLFVSDAGNQAIRKITPDGTVSTVAAVHGALALDAADMLYVADGAVIKKIASNGSSTIVAGIPDGLGIRLGALPASFLTIRSLTYLGANVFAVTSGNTVLKVALP